MTIQSYHEHTPPPPSTDSWVPVLASIGDLAQKLAATQFVPRAMQRQPASIAAAILTGREMGLGPMAALRGIDVIEGRPALTAQMLAARILTAGHKIEWVAADDKRCTVRIERGDGLSTAEATWTLADAQRAGLAGKKVWQQYPRHMLRARALSECASMACPDVALGLDVLEQPAEQPRDNTTGTSVVQIHNETTKPAVDEGSADPGHIQRTGNEIDQHHRSFPQETPDPPAQDQQETQPDPVTPSQIRKLNAQIGELERLDGKKYSRDERRGIIFDAANIDGLNSAKELTKQQAATAIDVLDKVIGTAITARQNTQDPSHPIEDEAGT